MGRGCCPKPFRAGLPFDRTMVAHHEVAHALVASVLGLPVREAWVLRRLDEHGIGGAVRLEMPRMASSTQALYGLLVRKVAVSVAGVAGARPSHAPHASNAGPPEAAEADGERHPGRRAGDERGGEGSRRQSR